MRLTDARGRPFHIFNTHLSLPTPFAREFWSAKDKMGYGVNQINEAKRLCTFIQNHAGREPFIVCGDFNSPPGSPVYRWLRDEAGLISAQETLGVINPTHPRGFPTAGLMRLRMHLDHLFSNDRVQWRDLDETAPFGRGRFHGLSDHVPLIGRFELP